MEQELKNAIRESGNNLHLEVAKFLKDLGWSVDISPYYCDDFTDKPREVDIIATRKIQILIGAQPEDTKNWFNVVLFIECKNFTKNINFRVFDNDEGMSKEILCRCACNLQIGNILKNSTLLNNHHYLTESNTAKLYEFEKESKSRNEQNDDIFKAMTQSVKSFLFFKEKKSGDVRGSINYPLIIYDKIDGIHAMYKNDTEDSYLDSLKKEKRAIFYLRYSYPKTTFGVPGIQYPTEDFYIDFVHKDELSKFLEDIEKNEIEKIKEFFGKVENR